MKATFVAELVPPGPVAVTEAVKMPAAVGVPLISPVLASIERPAGRPVAVHDVAGRFVESVKAGVWLNAVPTVPANVWSDVIIGDPPEMVMVIDADDPLEERDPMP